MSRSSSLRTGGSSTYQAGATRVGRRVEITPCPRTSSGGRTVMVYPQRADRRTDRGLGDGQVERSRVQRGSGSERNLCPKAWQVPGAGWPLERRCRFEARGAASAANKPPCFPFTARTRYRLVTGLARGPALSARQASSPRSAQTSWSPRAWGMVRRRRRPRSSGVSCGFHSGSTARDRQKHRDRLPRACGGTGCLREGVARRPRRAGGMGTDDAGPASTP